MTEEVSRLVRFIRDEKDCAAWAADNCVTPGGGPPGDPNGEKTAAIDGEKAIARVLELEAKNAGLETYIMQQEVRIGDLSGNVLKLKEMMHSIFAEKMALGVEHVRLQDALEALLSAAPECSEPQWLGALTEARSVLKSLEDLE